jgi:hypothetical protein
MVLDVGYGAMHLGCRRPWFMMSAYGTKRTDARLMSAMSDQQMFEIEPLCFLLAMLCVKQRGTCHR